MKRNFPIIDNTLTVTLFMFVAFSMFSISMTQISAGVGGFLWLLRTHLTNTWKEQRWPLGIPFLLYVLACLIAVANAYDVNHSYESLKKTSRNSDLFLDIELHPRKWIERLAIASSDSLCNARMLIRILSILADFLP